MPADQEEYIVEAGDCILSIATDHGLFWKTVWDNPDNRELRELRKDPNVLLPGDKVYMLRLRPKEIRIETGTRHGFLRKGIPAKLRFQLKDHDEPRKNEAYMLDIDGKIIEGETGSDGYVEERIPGNARNVKLYLNNGSEEFDIRLGGIDPIDTVLGVQTRLRNLGYDCPSSGKIDAGTTAAIRKFQMANKLKDDGIPDDGTQASLLKAHGS